MPRCRTSRSSGFARLVRRVGPESPTIEYKEQMADTIAKGVAALANTYGGLLLVGVTDDRIIKGGEGEDH